MSSESSSFRIEWRPSPGLAVALAALGVLASISVCLSAVPLYAKPPLALLALAYGSWLARRELKSPACVLTFSADAGRVAIMQAAGVARLASARVSFRGPLAVVVARFDDGTVRRFTWWPDTLPAGGRRSLSLASGQTVAETGPGLATMSG